MKDLFTSYMASFPQDWGSAAFSLLRTYQARGIWVERLTLVPCEEARISISSNSRDDYRFQLDKELEEINNQEMWLAGKQLRPLRPENSIK